MTRKDHHEYKVGDPAWIFLGDGGATKGWVVAVLDLETYGRQYVIAINTGIDDILEVRSGHILGMRPSDPRIGRIAEILERTATLSPEYSRTVATEILSELE